MPHVGGKDWAIGVSGNNSVAAKVPQLSRQEAAPVKDLDPAAPSLQGDNEENGDEKKSAVKPALPDADGGSTVPDPFGSYTGKMARSSV